MATAGRMPTKTVVASSTRDIPAMFPIMRPMNESTMSSDRNVDQHAASSGLADAIGQVILERGRQTIVHVDLNRDQEKVAHAKDRYMFHLESLFTFEP